MKILTKIMISSLLEIFYGLIFIIYLLFSLYFFRTEDYYIVYTIIVYSFLYLVYIFFLFLKKYNENLNIENFQKDHVTSLEYSLYKPLFDKILSQKEKIKIIKKEYRDNTDLINNFILKWTHQIKTPIFALKLLLDDDKYDKFLCKKELFKIEEYVQTVLGFLRRKSKSTDYSFEVINLDNIIKDSLKRYSYQIIDRHNKLEFKESGKNILTDKKWFSFIFEQVLSNANKYCENSKILIYFKDNNLFIKDYGKGIKSEDLPRVFEMGFTGNNGRIYKESTGIGLSLVKEIGKNLMIDTKIESEYNKSTTFIFKLKEVLR